MLTEVARTGSGICCAGGEDGRAGTRACLSLSCGCRQSAWTWAARGAPPACIHTRGHWVWGGMRVSPLGYRAGLPYWCRRIVHTQLIRVRQCPQITDRDSYQLWQPQASAVLGRQLLGTTAQANNSEGMHMQVLGRLAPHSLAPDLKVCPPCRRQARRERRRHMRKAPSTPAASCTPL